MIDFDEAGNRVVFHRPNRPRSRGMNGLRTINLTSIRVDGVEVAQQTEAGLVIAGRLLSKREALGLLNFLLTEATADGVLYDQCRIDEAQMHLDQCMMDPDRCTVSTPF